jgi:hypothetical protein
MKSTSLNYTLSSPGFIQYILALCTSLLGISFIISSLSSIPLSILFSLFTAFMVVENMIQDTYTVSITSVEIRITTSRFWWIKRQRVAPSGSLALSHIHSEIISGDKEAYRLDFEFVDDGGNQSYTIPSADVLLTGKEELARLEGMESDIRAFLGLREPPQELAKRVAKNRKKD